MKKIIVAAAGLMLVGTMASSAMAEVKFSGDARARYYYQDNYKPVDGYDYDQFKSRVRLNVEADTKGGAYAITRFHAGDGTWDGGNSGTEDVFVDRAYVGVPFGPVTVEGGRQGRDTTTFLYYGDDVDGVDLNYKNDNTLVVAFYDVAAEINTDVDHDDNTNMGVVLVQQFDGGWGLTVAGVYQNNDANYIGLAPAEDTDGFLGTVEVTGAIGAASVSGAIAFAEQDTLANTSVAADDGFGGFISASMPLGPVDLTGIVGGTTDGYMWDNDDFGPFEMLGAVNQISTGVNASALGETWFVVLNPSYKATEQLTLSAVFAYVPTDMYVDGMDDRDFMEISGKVSYAVTDGANLIGRVGYLDTDDLYEDDPIGAGMSLEVSF